MAIDTILLARRVLTMAGREPRRWRWRTAASLLGSRAEVSALRDSGTEVVDPGDGVVMPGLVEPHTHPDLCAQFYGAWAHSRYELAIAIIAQYQARRRPGPSRTAYRGARRWQGEREPRTAGPGGGWRVAVERCGGGRAHAGAHATPGAAPGEGRAQCTAADSQLG